MLISLTIPGQSTRIGTPVGIEVVRFETETDNCHMHVERPEL